MKADEEEAEPYPDVAPKLTVEVADSFVVHMIVAVVEVVEEATEEMTGAVVSGAVVVVRVYSLLVA